MLPQYPLTGVCKELLRAARKKLQYVRVFGHQAPVQQFLHLG